ncbi:MAG: hypothetical protein LUQ65_09925, partial [Candidatus Helarchaeota archaeon]|nr:hypothetical protein [Candidatus Helarchaeota archaeon]
MKHKKCIINSILVLLLLSSFYISGTIPLPQPSKVISTINSPFETLDSAELPVGIFYDIRYSEPWDIDSRELTTYLNRTLTTYGLSVSILNSTELRNFMEINQLAIVIITMGIVPDTIWNGSENSFVESWIDGGGIMAWTGCEEFYWIGTETGENIPIGHIGASYVFDMDYLKTIANLQVVPTEIGTDLFINLIPHSSDVFSSISSLIRENVYFEVYAKSGDCADPVLFQPKGGNGYFIRIHADWGNQLSMYNLSAWISLFLYNRFFLLPILTALHSINTIYFSTSAQLYVNITNFSGFPKKVLINSTSTGFTALDDSISMKPGDSLQVPITVSLQPSARFQNYTLQLNFFSNYTNFKNETINILIYSAIISIEIQSPIILEILTFEEFMYPGNTYTISFRIQKAINISIPIEINLICKGCINEIKLAVNLDEMNRTFHIVYPVQLMATPGSYELSLRIYQNDILYSSSMEFVEIYSLLQNLFVVIIMILLSVFAIMLLFYYFYIQNKQKTV